LREPELTVLLFFTPHCLENIMLRTRLFVLPVVLSLFIAAAVSATDAGPFKPVTCEGTYPHHLQGVCANGKDAIFWSFTTRLVKTDRAGKVLKQIEVGNHHGDLCFHDGRVYVAVNFGKFNQPAGKADSWVYVYNAGDLSLAAKHKVPEVVHGAGGIDQHRGHFFVVGGLPEKVNENYLYEYDSNFHFLKKHTLASGHTHLGIQTAAFADNHWWLGCYGQPAILLKADADLKQVERYEFNASLGIIPNGPHHFLIARDRNDKGKGHTGSLVAAVADKEQGMELLK
jgi:hypothetical protein